MPVSFFAHSVQHDQFLLDYGHPKNQLLRVYTEAEEIKYFVIFFSRISNRIFEDFRDVRRFSVLQNFSCPFAN